MMKFSYAEYVPAMKALSDETRLKILDMLSCGEMCACDILEEFSISQSTLSHHMKTLTESGLVSAVRDKSWMRYSLNKEKTDAVNSFLTAITNEKEVCICNEVRQHETNCTPENAHDGHHSVTGKALIIEKEAIK